MSINTAKLAMQDVFMWRCMGLALGMDSRIALGPNFISSYPGLYGEAVEGRQRGGELPQLAAMPSGCGGATRTVPARRRRAFVEG